MLGINMNGIGRLAYQLSEANNVPRRFDKEKAIALKKLYYCYVLPKKPAYSEVRCWATAS
jgi:hypothetical protein